MVIRNIIIFILSIIVYFNDGTVKVFEGVNYWRIVDNTYELRPRYFAGGEKCTIPIKQVKYIEIK